MIRVVRMMRRLPAPAANIPTATNCAEPAKTKADMAAAARGERPLVTATAPKMVAKGIDPMSKGTTAFAPAKNSLLGVGESVMSLIVR